MQYAVTLFSECEMERTVLNVCMYVRVYVICCAINPVTKSARACISENARKNQITFLKEEFPESVLLFRKTPRK